MNKRLYLEIFQELWKEESYYKECYLSQKKPDPQKLVELTSNLVFPLERGIEVRKHPCFLPEYLHTHDFLEICYVVSGSAKHLIFDNMVEQKEGEFLFLPPTVYHTIGVFDNSVVINILVNKMIITELVESFCLVSSPLASFFSTISSERPKVLKLNSALNEDVDTLVFLLAKKYKTNSSNEVLKSLLLSILYSLVDSKADYQFIGDSVVKGKTKAVALITYMRNNLSSVSLERLADYFSLSRERIAVIFATYLGTNYSDLIKHMRIEKSVTLLINSSLSCLEIATELGFSSAEHFSRVFKTWTGLTPTAYRMQKKR